MPSMNIDIFNSDAHSVQSLDLEIFIALALLGGEKFNKDVHDARYKGGEASEFRAILQIAEIVLLGIRAGAFLKDNFADLPPPLPPTA